MHVVTAAMCLLLVGVDTDVSVNSVNTPAPLRYQGKVDIDDSAWAFNTASFDQDKILSYNGFQYTLYWDADKVLCVVRRRLNTTEFQTLRLPQYQLTINPSDGHRNTVVGISPSDGRLHLSWDHHNNPLRYTKTRAAFLTDPPEQMSLDDFESAQPLIPGDPLESRVTYPRFLNDGQGRLFFVYRQGGSGSGDNYVHQYDAEHSTWQRMGATSLFTRSGVYPPWDNSSSRNAYLNDVLFDAASRLHATWTYRETGRTWASNHDLHYAYSDDHGIRWKNNAGVGIADLSANDPIALDDAGIVVHRIPVYSWLMNQTTMIIDSKNRPHVITYHLPNPLRPDTVEHSPPKAVAEQLRMFHYWRDAEGLWRGGEPLVFLSNRPGVVLDPQDQMIVYYVEDGGLTVHRSSADDRWQTWRSHRLGVPDVQLVAAGKPDRRLAASSGVVSFACVTQSAQNRRGFAILDFRVSQ
jgi:hypothetical protein